jgi:hypothetical protein
MFIAETGELRVMSPGPAFGAGTVTVDNGTDVSGTYQLRTFQTAPTGVPVPDQTCEIEGTVAERLTMQLTLRCTDPTGNTVERTVGMAYDPAYNSDSSLAEIAGNYRLAFNPQANVININGDGAIFGTFANGGANCTVNGQVQLIDPDFGIYRVEFGFSLCQASFNNYDGETLPGLALFLNAVNAPPGSFLLLLAGDVNGRFEVYSILYEPV